MRDRPRRELSLALIVAVFCAASDGVPLGPPSTGPMVDTEQQPVSIRSAIASSAKSASNNLTQLCLSPEPDEGFDLKRRALLWSGGPIDVTEHVVYTKPKPADVENAIGAALNLTDLGKYIRQLMQTQGLLWQCSTAAAICEGYSRVAPQLNISAAIQSFMDDECNLSLEHLDGTFMSHLEFVASFGALYMPKYSYRVLYLHSIMGTELNDFPMELSQIPKLQSLLTPFEFLHVEAFPSLLRLLDSLFAFLLENEHRLDAISHIVLYRVIDNKRLVLDADNLWIGLNYQLTHSMDLLPSTCWRTAGNQYAERVQTLFAHTDLLRKHGKLYVRIAPANTRLGDLGAGELAIDDYCAGFNPLASAATAEVMYENPNVTQSMAIGHNNTFEVVFDTRDVE